MGGAAASNEIRRQIDQCTLVPINQPWSLNNYQLCWPVSSMRNKQESFLSLIQRGGKKAVKIYDLDYCPTKVSVLRDCGSTLLPSK